jgi:hypothetical protein
MALHALGAVIPADAGIHLGAMHEAMWMPAFAGMTALWHEGLAARPSSSPPCSPQPRTTAFCLIPSTAVIPADAGIIPVRCLK